MRIGDRIAVMSQGGHVEQFATPADLLGRPANAFVADFVGADRGLKRLAVTGIDAADLERPPVVHVRDGMADARAAIERSGARWAVVLDDAENLHGWLSAERATGSGTVGSAGPPHGGVGAGGRVPEDGDGRDAAAGGRLGRGARRRPVPRRPDARTRCTPRCAARSRAPSPRPPDLCELSCRVGPGGSRAGATDALYACRGRLSGRGVVRRTTGMLGADALGGVGVLGGHAADRLQPQGRGHQGRRADDAHRRGHRVRPRRPAAAARPGRRAPARRSRYPRRRRPRRRWPGRARPAGRRASARPAAPAGSAASHRGACARPGPPGGRRAGSAGSGRRAPRRRRGRPAGAAATSAAAGSSPYQVRTSSQDATASPRARTRRSRRRTGRQCRWSQRVTASLSSAGSASSRSTTRPCPGSTAPGSSVAHGSRTNARSCACGCGRVSLGSSESDRRPVVLGDRDDVDVEGARPPPLLAGAAGGLLQLVRPDEPPVGVPRAAHDDDRIEVGRLLDRAPRRGLVQGRAGDQAVVLQGRDRRPDRAGAVAQVRPQGQHCARHARSRRMATVTSSKGTPSSACGLCTVISTASTSGSARQTLARRWARVSSRLTGSPVRTA